VIAALLALALAAPPTELGAALRRLADEDVAGAAPVIEAAVAAPATRRRSRPWASSASTSTATARR
jgi:hypothetical protein